MTIWAFTKEEACNGCSHARWHNCTECGKIEFCKCVMGWEKHIDVVTGHCPHFGRGGVVHNIMKKINL
jgi:hypothetical protein